MRARVLGGISLVAVACGGAGSPVHQDRHSPPEVPQVAPDLEPASLEYELPSPAPARERAMVCRLERNRAYGRVQPQSQQKSYDFEGDTVLPLPHGPHTLAMGPQRGGRDREHVRSAVRVVAPHLNGCYRWVRFGLRNEHRDEHVLDVEMTVDPIGAVSKLQVRPTTPSSSEAELLATCVEEGLRAVRLQHVSASTTLVKGTIHFQTSDLARPKKRPTRPAPRDAASKTYAGACEGLPETLPTETVEVGEIIRIDDWEAEHERELLRSKWKDMPGRYLPMPVEWDCAYDRWSANKGLIRDVVRSNAGAYRSCYRQALDRKPDLEGTISVVFLLRDGNQIRDVTVGRGDVGDDELRDCLKTAFEELGGHPWLPFDFYTETRVRYGLQLQRPPRDPPVGTALEKARARLALGDGEEAARMFAEVVRGSRHGADECAGRLGVLRSMLVEAPAPSDERVVQAAVDLATYAGGPHAKSADSECLRDAAEATSRVAAWPLSQRIVAQAFGPSDDRWVFRSFGNIAGRARRIREAWPEHPLAYGLWLLELEGRIASGERVDFAAVRAELERRGTVTRADDGIDRLERLSVNPVALTRLDASHCERPH